MTGEQSTDHSIAAAWEAFRADLARELRDLEPGAFTSLTILESTFDVTGPYLQFFKSDDSALILSEVSSNQVLADRFRLSAGQIGELLRIGWVPPSPPTDESPIPNFHLVDTDVEAAVDRARETLQSVFGIPHPAFLTPAPDEDELHRKDSPPEDPHRGEEPLDPDEAYHPASAEDLAWAVSQALRNHFGTYRPPDAAGGFAIKVGSAGMLVTPHADGAVSVVAFVVRDMDSPEDAAELLALINQDLYVRFHVSGTALLASCDIPAVPFVPRHLYTVLTAMGRTVDRVDEQLAAVTGGATLFEENRSPDPSGSGTAGGRRDPAAGDVDDGYDDDNRDDGDDDELPEELLTLIHLENDESLELDPGVVAGLMRHDRTFILHCIRLAEEQMISWAAGAQEEDDPEEREARLHESRGWEETVATLRGALHAVVAGTAGGGAAGSGGDGRGGGRNGPAASGPTVAGVATDPDEDDDEFSEQCSAWARTLTREIHPLEPGETLFVVADPAHGGTRATLSVSRYLGSGVLCRIILTGGSPSGLSPDGLAELAEFGWRPVPAAGSTGPARLVKSAETHTPELALDCLAGLMGTGCLTSFDDLTLARRTDHGDWRRLPPHLRVAITSVEGLRSSVTLALQALGARPARRDGGRLVSAAADHTVEVEIDPDALRLTVAAPVVLDPDPALIRADRGLLPESGFDWLFDGERVVLDAGLDAAPFQPGHLEIVLAAAEDLILLHSRAVAAEFGGASAIEHYLTDTPG